MDADVLATHRRGNRTAEVDLTNTSIRTASGRSHPAWRKHGAGFTLIEAALAVSIVGVGIVALLHSMAAGTLVNSQGQDITHAVFLSQAIREWTLALPFSDPDENDAANPPGPDGTDSQIFVDDLDDLLGVTYSPPRDGQGYPIDAMSGWSQQIQLQWRDPNSLTTNVPTGSTDVVCVTVTVSHSNRPVLTTSWFVTRKR